MFKHEAYDQSDVFFSQINPLLEKAHKIADENGISIVMIAQYLQREGKEKGTMEAGLSKKITLAGPERCVPGLMAASFCADDPKKALVALMVADMMDGGARPDPKAEMLKDGTTDELDGAKDAVESLMAHLGKTPPAGNC